MDINIGNGNHPGLPDGSVYGEVTHTTITVDKLIAAQNRAGLSTFVRELSICASIIEFLFSCISPPSPLSTHGQGARGFFKFAVTARTMPSLEVLESGTRALHNLSPPVFMPFV